MLGCLEMLLEQKKKKRSRFNERLLDPTAIPPVTQSPTFMVELDSKYSSSCWVWNTICVQWSAEFWAQVRSFDWFLLR